MTPKYSLSAPEGFNSVNVTIRGESIASGDARDDLPQVIVGGVRCASIHRFSAVEIACLGLDASKWSAAGVEVEVGGYATKASDVFSFIGRPQVLSVSL